MWSVAFLIAVAASADAGVVYRYASTIKGNPLTKGGSGRVWVEGTNQRQELDPDASNPRAWDVAISNGTDTRLVNLGNQTWYREKPPAKMPSELEIKLDGKPKIEYRVEETETVAGRTATKHVIVFAYKVVQNFGGTRVRTNFSTTVFLWIAHDLPTVPLRHFVANEYDAVNRALTEVLDGIDGMPLRVRTSSTRKVDGGPPFTTSVETEISDIEQKDVAAAMFQVPPSFREQEPVIGFASPER